MFRSTKQTNPSKSNTLGPNKQQAQIISKSESGKKQSQIVTSGFVKVGQSKDGWMVDRWLEERESDLRILWKRGRVDLVRPAIAISETLISSLSYVSLCLRMATEDWSLLTLCSRKY